MRRLSLIISLLLPILTWAQSPYQTIYGEDDRLDLYEVESDKIKTVSRSVAALIWSKKIQLQKETYKLDLKSYSKRFGMCQDVRFADQPSAPFATGFLVGPKHLMTAAHAIVNEKSERFYEELPCNEVSVIFDYQLESKDQNLKLASKNQVYNCRQVLKRKIRWMKEDYALIELDRDVVGREALSFVPHSEIKPGAPVVTIGHPHGLPMKVSGNAMIRELDGDRFSMNTDTSGGNSGSPVFHAITMEVIGIHVSGEVDFTRSRGCKIHKKCKDDECWGSWAFRPPQSFLDSLPQYFSKN